MKTVTFDNKVGSRSLKHVNCLIGMYKDHQVIVPFEGANIEGVCHIIAEDYTKNGKWSHSTWKIAVPDDVEDFELFQDWEMGTYFPQKTWEGVYKKILEAMKRDSFYATILDMDCVKRFITAKFPTTAQDCCASAQILNELNSNFGDLYEAQKELMDAQAELDSVKTAIQDLITAETTRKQAESIRAKTRDVRAAMAKGASLADLQAMFNQGE